MFSFSLEKKIITHTFTLLASFAIITGIFSYIIYFIGIFGFLSKTPLLSLSLLYLLCSVFVLIKFRQRINLKNFKKIDFFLISLIIIQSLVNFIGVLGPEISFDALWYHLTLPKLFIEKGEVFYISGGLYDYSLMPKLVEMLYIPGTLFFGSTGAKLIHFSFGLLTLLTIYFLSRKFVSKTLSLIAVIIFYSNLVVGWEIITAYIDLGRTFYELLAFSAFILFFKSNKFKYLILSAIFLGFAFSTKILALSSLLIFIVLLIYKSFTERSTKHFFVNLLIFVSISLLVPLPYFVFSFLETGNPIYPLFTEFYSPQPVLSFHNLLVETWSLFTNAPDPISPIYLIFLPLIVYSFKKLKGVEKLFAIYSLLALFVWFVTPRIGGGRFILPYLPVASILCALVISSIEKKWFRNYLISLVILCSLISIGYRAIANLKFVPVVLGKESREEFLLKNLNFEFGDFIDVGSEVKKRTLGEKVLIIGGHNLYYADFPFVHESFAKKGENYKYVLVINGKLPSRFKNYKKIYENSLTHAKLYINGGK